MNKFIKLWSFVNSPLIAVILGISLWTLTQHLIMSHMIKKYTLPVEMMQQEETDKALTAVEIFPLVSLLDVKEANSEDHTIQKYIGRVSNSSDFIVGDIQVVATYYNNQNEVFDMDEAVLYSVEYLAPGQSKPFIIERSLKDYRAKEEDPARPKASRANIEVLSFEIENNSKKK